LMTTIGHWHIMSKCRGMRSVVLDDWDNCSADLVENLAINSCTTLTNIEIGGSKKVRNSTLHVILHHCQLLSHLKVFGASRVILYPLIYDVLQLGNKLHTLHVVGCQRGEQDATTKDKNAATLKTLILDSVQLRNPDVTDILNWFPSVTNVSLLGTASSLSQTSLLDIANRIHVSSLAIDFRTGIKHPLSWLTDSPHAAKLSHLSFPYFDAQDLFTPHSLDTVTTEQRIPNTHVTHLSCTRPEKVYPEDTSFPLIFQALFYLLPNLQSLDMTHQFIGFAQHVGLPRNGLLEFVQCKHDHIELLGLNMGAKLRKQKCLREPRPLLGLLASSSESADLDLFWADIFY